MGRQLGSPLLIAASVLTLLGLIVPVTASAGQTFIGRFQYEDRDFGFYGFTGKSAPRPIRFADVRIVSGNATIAMGATGEDGSFFIQMPDTAPQSLRALCVTASTMTPGLLIDVRVAGDDFSFGDFYSVASAPKDTPGYGIVNFGITLAAQGSDAGKAFNIWDASADCMQFVASPEAYGRYPDTKLTVIWRFDHHYSGSYYSGPMDNRYIYLDPQNVYDDTVISHETGHFIDDLYFKSDSPGGKHYIGYDNQDIRLAWAEGLATFLGSSVRKFRGYSRPEIYVDTDGINLNFSFENELLESSIRIRSRTGSTNELAVAAALWDIVDGPDTDDSYYGEDDDRVERPFADVWNVLHRHLPTINRPGISVENFWDGWLSLQGGSDSLSEMEFVFAGLNGIEYLSDSQEPDDKAAFAMPVPNGQVKHYTYYPEGDADWMSIEVESGKDYIIETLNLSNGADTIVDVFAPDAVTMLATSNDYGSTSSYLNWKAPSGGTYFVRSQQRSGLGTFARYGSYYLRVAEVSASEPAGSLLTVSRPGLGGEFENLSDAVERASSGDTIQILDNASYPERLSIRGKSLTLSAAAGKNPVLDSRSIMIAPAITITDSPKVRIEGISILGGSQGISIDNSSATVVNTIITGTAADGIRVAGEGSSAEVVNCTIAMNGQFGVGVWNYGSVRIANTIFNSNGADDLGGDGSGLSIAITHSLISTAPFSGNYRNLTGDPRFVDPLDWDFRLLPGSPAIDSGDPDFPSLPPTDADGIPRSIDGLSAGIPTPDMGAFEFMPTRTLTSAAVFPQFVSGGIQPGYETTLVAINSGNAPANVNISLHGSDGAPLVVNRSNSIQAGYSPQEASSGGDRSSFNLSIAAKGTARLDSARSGNLLSGFARLLSSNQIDGAAVIRGYRDNQLHTEAGVAFSKPARRLIIQVDNANDANTGYAIANPGSTEARMSVILRDENGTLVESKSLVLDAGKHFAEFSSERFPQSAVPGFKGTAEFVSDQEISGLALRLDNPEMDVLSNLPPLVNEAAGGLVFPLAVDGGGYRTGILLTNPSTSNDARVMIEFFAEDGTAMEVVIGDAARTSYEAVIRPGGVAHIFTNGVSTLMKTGWIRITSSSAIGGSVVLQTVAETKILSAAGVIPSPAVKHLTTYVESRDTVASGLALCNPDSGAVTVTLNLRNPSGQIVASTRFTIPAMGKVAKFVSGPGQWFESGFEQFEGSLEVVASGPISGVAVRYDNDAANVFTTLPVIGVGPTQEE